jgi:hypothetical protein
VREVVRRAVALAHRPARALLQHAAHLLLAEPADGVVRADPARHVPEELGHHLLDVRAHLLDVQRGGHQAHAAVDVVAHSTRRDDALLLVHRGHAADGEAVAPVDVGHRQRRLHDPRQVRHVADLLQAGVLAQGRHQPLAGVDDARHAHAALPRDLEAVLVELA